MTIPDCTVRRTRHAVLLALFSVVLPITATAESVSAPQVVATLESTFGVHPGERRNHIKGTCAVGEFVGTQNAAALSTSPLFSGATIPIVARLSLAGGSPTVADAAPVARGMALEFRLPGSQLQHITMLSTPVFVSAKPEAFNALLMALKPDAKTGQPEPAKMREFFSGHPEAMQYADFLQKGRPSASYANTAFYSVHAFKFVNGRNAEHVVKWRFLPLDGERPMSASALKSAPHDFLEKNLVDRLRRGPVRWDMIVTVGKPGDSEDNPTLAWPAARQQFKAGTLTLSLAMPQRGAECEKVNFDPLVMAEGIRPTSDPILLFRSPAYAVSFGKRLSGQ